MTARQDMPPESCKKLVGGHSPPPTKRPPSPPCDLPEKLQPSSSRLMSLSWLTPRKIARMVSASADWIIAPSRTRERMASTWAWGSSARTNSSITAACSSLWKSTICFNEAISDHRRRRPEHRPEFGQVIPCQLELRGSTPASQGLRPQLPLSGLVGCCAALLRWEMLSPVLADLARSVGRGGTGATRSGHCIVAIALPAPDQHRATACQLHHDGERIDGPVKGSQHSGYGIDALRFRERTSLKESSCRHRIFTKYS